MTVKHLIALLFFVHVYGLDTTAPAFPQMHGERPRVADHGFTITTPEWRGVSLTHTMTSYWVNDALGRNMVGSVQYDVELRARIARTTLTVGHESFHNVDVTGPDREWNRVGVEVKL
jgi:hypothetical protein